MKALFTAFPAYGHAIPLLPLAEAASAAGDEVVLVLDHSLHHLIPEGLRAIDLGPGVTELLVENERRTAQDASGFRADDADDLLATTVALFTATRAHASLESLQSTIAAEGPDLVVTEMWDYLAPLAASRAGVPWAPVNHSPTTGLDDLLHDGMLQVARDQAIVVTDPLLVVQQWPSWLQPEPLGDVRRLELGSGLRIAPEDGTRAEDAPVVLVTLGTVVQDAALLERAVVAAAAAGARVTATTGVAAVEPDLSGVPGVKTTSFRPLAELLSGTDAVIAAGGSGTALATLARGIPSVFVPRVANQPLVASLVAQAGAGLVHEDSDDLSAQLSRVLDEPQFREAAREAAARLAAEPDASSVWRELRAATHR